jgi:alpha-tubulin suppressor-like RCC1 family protein
VRTWGYSNYGLGDGSHTSSTAAITPSGVALNDTSAPSVPGSLQMSEQRVNSVKLSWAAATDNVGVTAYEVYRDGTLVATTSATSAYVFGLKPGTNYDLTVLAKDVAGNMSVQSSALQVSAAGYGSVRVALGQSHALLVTEGGTVEGWGHNNYGQLGDGTTTDRATAVGVKKVGSVVAVAAGLSHSLALTSNGQVWVWGDNGYGQLGVGSGQAPAEPTLLTETDVVAVAAGYDHTVLLKSDGTVWGFGQAGDGQVGSPMTSYVYQARAIPGATEMVAVAAGNDFTLMLKADGTVWACGYNGGGQLGANGTTGSVALVQVGSVNGVVAIAAGGDHGMALKSDGTVWQWGTRYDSSDSEIHSPGQMSGLSGVVAIASGGDHRLALKSNGTVWGWSYNGYGQLGNGNTTNQWSAVQASVVSGVSAIAAGKYWSAALKSDGTVRTWGYNQYGLGDGSHTSSTAAMVVDTNLINPPSEPSNLLLTNQTSTSVTLSWGVPTNGGAGIVGYEVFRGGESLGITVGLSMNIAGLVALDNGLGVAVRAVDAAGNYSPEAGLVVRFADATAPTAPVGLTYAEKTDHVVTLLWGAASDNVEVVAYDVYRDGTWIGSTSEQTYYDRGLTANTPYSYTVKARDAVPNTSVASNTLSITTLADQSADSDADGLSNQVETALGTSAGTTSGDTTNETEQNIHRPVR